MRTIFPILLVILFVSCAISAQTVDYSLSYNETMNRLNVTGILDGSWSTSEVPAASSLATFLKIELSRGSAELWTSSRAIVNETFTLIQALLIARDGEYETERNARFGVEGVHDRENGVILGRVWPLGASAFQTPLRFDWTLANATEMRSFITTFYSNASAVNETLLGDPDLNKFMCHYKAELFVTPDKAPPTDPAYESEERDENMEEIIHGRRESRKVDPEIYRPVLVRGRIFSEDCNKSMLLDLTRLDEKPLYTKIHAYLFVVTLVTLGQILLTIKQMDYSATQSRLNKISVLTMNEQGVMDSFLCIVHMINAVKHDDAFNAFITVAFVEFALFVLFEIRYVMMIYKTHRTTVAEENSGLTRQLGTLYFRLYGLHMVLVFLFFISGGKSRLFIFALYGYFIPQIVRNAQHGTSHALRHSYIIGMTLLRLVLPLYMCLCPSNWFRSEPYPIFSVVLVAFCLLQAVILLCQDRFGPSFFVPKWLRPAKYNYHRTTPLVSENHDCVICMTAVPPETANHEYMVTPCNHIFHTACLEQWLAVKLECPTCRHVLPPIS